MNKIIKILIAMLFLIPIVYASELFYEGGITVDSINANIVIDTNARISVDYTLINEGDREESVSLSSGGKLETVLLKPKEQKIINIMYTGNVSGETTKVFSFNPTLTFDGKPNSKRVKSLFTEIILPSGIQKIIWSNKNYNSKGVNTDGRTYYTWADRDIYPAILIVKWSTLNIDLNIIKEASPIKITTPNQTINIKIILENKGERDVNNIILIDDYVPSEFQPVAPVEEFIIPSENRSDPRLIWTKSIAQLRPKETKTIEYSIKYIGEVTQIYTMELKPSTVIVNGNLVGVSNSVKITKMVGAEVSKVSTGPFTYLIIGAVIVVAVLAYALIKLRKKKKR